MLFNLLISLIMDLSHWWYTCRCHTWAQKHPIHKGLAVWPKCSG